MWGGLLASVSNFLGFRAEVAIGLLVVEERDAFLNPTVSRHLNISDNFRRILRLCLTSMMLCRPLQPSILVSARSFSVIGWPAS